MPEKYLFTSESVSQAHPDKVADTISDTILDAMLAQDAESRVACETMVKSNFCLIAGEITSKAQVNIEKLVRETICNIGYDKDELGFNGNSCEVKILIEKQASDISLGVTADEKNSKEQGAGDQGMMFGFACNDTKELMPLPIQLAHQMMMRLTEMRKSGQIRWLRPDSKGQFTVEYLNGLPLRIDTVVLSTQHDESVCESNSNLSEKARNELIEKIILPIIPQHFVNSDIKFFINPTGRFVEGGPKADCGLTGRKIIVDTYGGMGRHGGGAFSGKDASKVDRSAAYYARYIAKNIVAAGLAKRCEVQLAYAIGRAEPVSIFVDTFCTNAIPEEKIISLIREHFRLKPAEIIEELQLKRPIFQKTASFGHFGREIPEFTWERTDKKDMLSKYK